MTKRLQRLPLLIVVSAIVVLAWHGPVAQLPHYHEFADTRSWAGIANGADVFSNLGFLLVGLTGLAFLPAMRRHPSFASSWLAYALFFLALLLTAFGSGFYHLAPDNSRLVWDRLPIALACAALLAAVRSETVTFAHACRDLAGLAIAAMASVAWWHYTESRGHGDLRPYLLLQALPLVLIPLWQALYRRPAAERAMFALAIGLYVAAKAAELSDRAILDGLGFVSGHTLKHLLASLGAAAILAGVVRRIHANSAVIFTSFYVSALQSAQDSRARKAGRS